MRAFTLRDSVLLVGLSIFTFISFAMNMLSLEQYEISAKGMLALTVWYMGLIVMLLVTGVFWQHNRRLEGWVWYSLVVLILVGMGVLEWFRNWPPFVLPWRHMDLFFP